MIGAANAREIPLAPYVTFGTEELAEVAVRFCGDAKAVLLANHGLVACGSSLADAFGLAETWNMSPSCNTGPDAQAARTCSPTNRSTRR